LIPRGPVHERLPAGLRGTPTTGRAVHRPSLSEDGPKIPRRRSGPPTISRCCSGCGWLSR
jgi:hypothetical protein